MTKSRAVEFSKSMQCDNAWALRHGMGRFFFSSRRRHRRCRRDWSSDVCSSDLQDLREKVLPLLLASNHALCLHSVKNQDKLELIKILKAVKATKEMGWLYFDT